MVDPIGERREPAADPLPLDRNFESSSSGDAGSGLAGGLIALAQAITGFNRDLKIRADTLNAISSRVRTLAADGPARSDWPTQAAEIGNLLDVAWSVAALTGSQAKVLERVSGEIRMVAHRARALKLGRAESLGDIVSLDRYREMHVAGFAGMDATGLQGILARLQGCVDEQLGYNAQAADRLGEIEDRLSRLELRD